jgi:hypothetical protein
MVSIRDQYTAYVFLCDQGRHAIIGCRENIFIASEKKESLIAFVAFFYSMTHDI